MKILLPMLKILIQLLLIGFYVSLYHAEEDSIPPHIVFILGDDVGWNDVSFHGATDIPTPNIDALALSGVILNNYYGEWMCTPSRSALLSGKYPMRLGLQSFVIVAGEATALPLDVTTLPQHLKKLGYETHIVGKWHLGYHTKAYMPTHRGFDTFFGYLNGYIDYYDYTHSVSLPNQSVFFGIDLYNGTDVVPNFRGEYATKVFGNRANDIIMEHDISKPLFLFLSHLAIHTGNVNQPMQAPPEKIAQFSYIDDPNRRIHAARLSELDDTVGSVFEALRRKDMLKNSIVVFVSDNGGENNRSRNGYSSNFPLRGNKFTVWEGGVHVPGVIWSPLLALDRPLVSKQLMHVSDWFPTIYSAAGGNVDELGKIDGINMWDVFTKNASSPRKDLLNGIDSFYGLSAFRNGNYKIINGSTGMHDFWYGPTGSENVKEPDSMFRWVFKNGSVVRDILVQEGWWIAEKPDEVYDIARVTCQQPSSSGAYDCKPDEGPCLFNIANDPCEYHNLANEFPDVVNSMMERIRIYEEEQMPLQRKMSDPRADPLCHHFAFVPWLEPEHYNKCDYS